MMPEPLFMHIHIVKNAGTTFEAILQSNFGPDYVNDKAYFFEQYTLDQVNSLIDAQPFMHAYSSHKLSLSLPFDCRDRQVMAIAFVRDPVQRFKSHYEMHHGRQTRNLDTAPNVARMSRREYVRWALEEGNLPGYIDGQLRYLTPECVSGTAAVEEAVRAGRLLLFPVDRFNEACVLLERRFPERFRDCAYLRQNAAPQRLDWSDEENEVIRQHVGQQDERLLALANRWLDEQMKIHAGDPETIRERLADLQKRCRQLAEPPPPPAIPPPMGIRRRLRAAAYILRCGRLP